jgi:hypothetical protein
MNEPSSGFDPVEELFDAFLDRLRRGERPRLTEYTAQHPELVERIRAPFHALVVIEELGRLPGDAESVFRNWPRPMNRPTNQPTSTAATHKGRCDDAVRLIPTAQARHIAWVAQASAVIGAAIIGGGAQFTVASSLSQLPRRHERPYDSLEQNESRVTISLRRHDASVSSEGSDCRHLVKEVRRV